MRKVNWGQPAEALQLAFPDVADPSQYLFDYLHEKAMLLVFDNYEQLLPDVAFLQALLAAAPGVKLFVTSRERLHLSQEWLLPLSGLAFPDEQTMSRQPENATSIQISQFDALTLFVKCAQRVRTDFAFSHDPAAIIQICQLVGGMPLAIELATGWLRILSCRQIADKLTADLDLLTTKLQDIAARHQSMKAVFVQSWQFLTENEQCILRRLAVFRSSFLYDAAIAITGAELSLLLGLVDKSLLQTDGSGRFQLHELLRQFALEQLKHAAAEYHVTQNAYSTYYLRLLHQYIHVEMQALPQAYPEQVAKEAANILATWHWVIEQEDVAAIGEAVYDVHLYANICGYHNFYPITEKAAALLRRRLQKSAAIEDQSQLTQMVVVHTRLLYSLGVTCYRLGYRKHAYGLADEAENLLNMLPATANSERAWVHILMGWRAYFQGNLEEARSQGQIAFNLFGPHATALERGAPQVLLGWSAYMAGDHERTEHHLAALNEDLASPVYASSTYTLPPLTAVARARGNYERALTLMHQCYTTQRQTNDVVGSTYSLCSLAHIYRTQRQFDQAIVYYQAAIANAKEYGLQPAIETAQYGLGRVYFEKGEFTQARHFFESNLRQSSKQNNRTTSLGIAANLNGLAAVATAQEQYTEATHHLHQALTIAQQSAAIPLLLDILLQWATLVWRQGQIEQAVHLLHTVQQHPATKHATRANADRLLAEIAALSGETLAISNQQGKTIDLEVLVAGLLSAASHTDWGRMATP